MGDKAKIEWTDATWNVSTGCNKVSDGCKHCYAERQWARLASMPNTVYHGRNFTDLKCHPERLEQPLLWKRPRKIFVNSMSDLFHPGVPFNFVDKVFGVMLEAPQHTFQVLTKRPERALEYLENLTIIPGNLWMGISAENQDSLDSRSMFAFKFRAFTIFLSLEPLIGQITIPRFLIGTIDQVIVGGESGPKARPMNIDWVRSIRDQCIETDTPFLFKQWGEWKPVNQNSPERGMHCCGKRAAGRTLDGKIWDEYPVIGSSG